jgi:hypothetical protein
VKASNEIQTTIRTTVQTEPQTFAGQRYAQHALPRSTGGTEQRKTDATLAIKARNVVLLWGAIVAPACAMIDEPGSIDEASGGLSVSQQALDHAEPTPEAQVVEMVEESQPAVVSAAINTKEIGNSRERQACLNDGTQPPPPVVRVRRDTPETARHHFAEESLVVWLDQQLSPEAELGRIVHDEILQALSDLDALRMAEPVGEHSLRSQTSLQPIEARTEATEWSAAKLSGVFPND